MELRPAAGTGQDSCRQWVRDEAHSRRRVRGAQPAAVRSEARDRRRAPDGFLRRKWARELDYALRKELWSFYGNRIAVRFHYECHDEAGSWWRNYGNELWEFTGEGLMCRREASINDLAIVEADRRIHGPRPEAEGGLSIPLR